MIKVATSQARKDLSSIIHGASRGERFLLCRHDEGVAAVVSVEDLELLQTIEDRMDARAARVALADAEVNGTVPWEEVKAELGL